MTDQQKGFALLIVLLALGFLSLLGTQIIASARSDAQVTNNLMQEAVLEAAANGAVADVVFRLLAARDPDFQADGVVRELHVGSVAVRVRVRNESDFVNLNTASGALLRALILEAGGARSIADRLAPAILDWHTPEANSWRRAKAPEYRAAALDYGPPETSFRSVSELADVLGMTPALLARLAPHLTVFTNNDPELSTRDPVVARALSDVAPFGTDSDDAQQMAKVMLRQTRALTTAARVADGIEAVAQKAEQMLRISATAVGKGSARYVAVVVVSADFQSPSPRVKILSRERRVDPEADRERQACGPPIRVLPRSPREISAERPVDETFMLTCDDGDPNE